MADDSKKARTSPNRFAPGRSGNPKGRPKGSPNMTAIVQEFALKKHRVKVDGRNEIVTTADVLMRALRAKAASGDVRAMKIEDGLRARMQPQQAQEAGYLLVPAPMTVEEWDLLAEVTPPPCGPKR